MSVKTVSMHTKPTLLCRQNTNPAKSESSQNMLRVTTVVTRTLILTQVFTSYDPKTMQINIVPEMSTIKGLNQTEQKRRGMCLSTCKSMIPILILILFQIPNLILI